MWPPTYTPPIPSDAAAHGLVEVDDNGQFGSYFPKCSIQSWFCAAAGRQASARAVVIRARRSQRVVGVRFDAMQFRDMGILLLWSARSGTREVGLRRAFDVVPEHLARSRSPSVGEQKGSDRR